MSSLKALYKVQIGNGCKQLIYYSIESDVEKVTSWAIEKFKKEHKFATITYLICSFECQEHNIQQE